MHKAYKADEVVDGVKIKEYTLSSGKRMDFIDLEDKVIYELKPDNASGAAVFVEFKAQSYGCSDRIYNLKGRAVLGPGEASKQRDQGISDWMTANGFSKGQNEN